MKCLVQHTTAYRYSEPASLGHSEARLTPRTFARQRCSVQPDHGPAPDGGLGGVGRLLRQPRQLFHGGAGACRVDHCRSERSRGRRTAISGRGPDAPLGAGADRTGFPRAALRRSPPPSSCSIHRTSARSPGSAAYAAPSFPPGRPLLEAVLDLTARIHREFRYTPASTTVSTPIREVFEQRRGVCQDFAHLQIACLRSLGLAARYVSGYLLTDPPPGSPKLIGADALACLAQRLLSGRWLAGRRPHQQPDAGARHLTLVWGREYPHVCPVKGVVLGGGQHLMRVAVDVAPTARRGMIRPTCRIPLRFITRP